MGSQESELSADVRTVKAKIAAMPAVQYNNAGDQGRADGIRARSEAPASTVPAMPGPTFANSGAMPAPSRYGDHGNDGYSYRQPSTDAGTAGLYGAQVRPPNRVCARCGRPWT